MTRRTYEDRDEDTGPGGVGVSVIGVPSGRLRTFESFRVPAYRIYYGSMVGNWFAQSMQMLVRSLLIYRITESAAIIGIMALAQSLPALVVSLLGGALGDRMQKRYILLACRAGLAVLALGVALALALGYLGPGHPESWWLLVLAAGLEGTINGFLMPTNMSIVPEIVSEERVMNAISLSSMGQNVFRLMSPVLAGYIVDHYGFTYVYGIMTFMYIIATVCTGFLPRTGVRNRSGSALSDVVNGLRYLRRETVVLLIVLFGLFHVISGQPFQQLLPVFTEDILKVGATQMGLLMMVSAAGALAGALALASLPNRRRGVLLVFSGIIMGLAVVVFSFSRWWYLSLGMMVFTGLGPTMHSALTATLIQTHVDPDYRARMQSFATMTNGLAAFGTFFAGVLAGVVGVQWSVGGMAIFLVFVSIMFLTLTARLRKLD